MAPSPGDPPTPGDPPSANSSGLAEFQRWVWTRYVQHQLPEQLLAEVVALVRSHPGVTGADAAAECFYYGILAFGQTFAEPQRSRELLDHALTTFRAQRAHDPRGLPWTTTGGLYQEVLELLGLTAKAAH